jgi:hypothetical protein
VVAFRPTFAQAIGRGAYLGALVGVNGTVVVLVVLITAGAGAGFEVSAWVVSAGPLVLGCAVGAALGVVVGRHEGADVDDRGIQPVPAEAAGFAPWRTILDLRVERRGGRAHVAVYLDSGQVGRLRAPYDGRFLAADPEFERKLFMLRHLWETHRSFTLNNRQTAADDA